jgi:hypothetical protein
VATKLTILERTVDGKSLNEHTIEFRTERLTIHDLIRSYDCQEVTEDNACRYARSARSTRSESYSIVPDNANLLQRIEWEPEFQKALRAFESRAHVIVVDGHQVESLDDEFEVQIDTSVAFLRLLPLIGR